MNESCTLMLPNSKTIVCRYIYSGTEISDIYMALKGIFKNITMVHD